ncbi:hypothetical protein [Streptomyces sp. NPDC047043]|uniref:hypothetical protein n=1 Tax=Streptomyces sp. NPDC047043 TaxID=3154497 RepID=UPI0033FD4948
MNIEKVAHRWKSLPEGSPAKAELAPPEVVKAKYLGVLAAMVGGFWVMVSGGVLLGLLVAVGGLLWGVFTSREASASLAARSRWSREVICLACLHRWVP